MSLLPSGQSLQSPENSESWMHRVVENLRLAVLVARIKPSAANGAPLHFESIEMSARNGRAQTFSAGVHAAILAILLFAIVATPVPRSRLERIPLDPGKTLLRYVPALHPEATGQPSLGSDGSGGGRETLPTRVGDLVPFSSMPLAPPRLNRNTQDELAVPPAIFDPNAPTNVPTVTHLGLPWGDPNTDSAGPGKGHGFGNGDGNTMGDGTGPGAGDGTGNRPYANVVSPVTCLYCPDPGYTEEARKAKVQGKILLQVLVGPDGKAQRIEILRGLDAGLEERTREAIRGWRFSPGLDAAKRPVTAWVTIETRFQLF
jgi:periplasmic protein TonB